MVKYADQNVEYVNHMGNDTSVVNAARVSFAKTVIDFDEEKDSKLINYLAKHNHWSPFAHTSITIRCKAPIFVARQMVKHKIGGDWNEESRRYIDDEPEFYTPSVIRGKPISAKQGSSDVDLTHKVIRHSFGGGGQIQIPYLFDVANETNLAIYTLLLEQGVAPEQARLVLPQSVMTNWMWTGSVAFFARVCKLRLDSHAQKESQELAKKIADVVAPLYPHSWSALMEHMRV